MTFSKSVHGKKYFCGDREGRTKCCFYALLKSCNLLFFFLSFFLSFVLHVLFEALRLFLSFPTSFANSSSFELKLIYNIVCIKPA